MSQLVEDLLQAKQELINRGWNKGQLISSVDGSCCALGAIGCATVEGFSGEFESEIHDGDRFGLLRTSPRALAAVTAVADQLDHRSITFTGDQDDVASIWEVNDRHATTLEDVYGFFDAALAAAQ